MNNKVLLIKAYLVRDKIWTNIRITRYLGLTEKWVAMEGDGGGWKRYDKSVGRKWCFYCRNEKK